MELRAADLFSGIGGFTLALECFENVTTALYCDIDARSQEVITHRMQQGELPRAPMYKDVQKVHLPPDVNMIVGGFPCFPAGTRVLTDQGYMPIETVSGDQKLLTHTGSWKPIENVQQKLFTGRMASVSVECHDQPIMCTDNHPFYARTLDNPDPVWVHAHDLTTDHYVGIPINSTQYVPTCDDPNFIENGYAWYAVTKVDFSHAEQVWVYNFQVQDDHSYVVENVVVKNCTGFSLVGARESTNNSGSGLVRELYRLMEESKPAFVMMENVAPILNYPEYKTICDTMTGLGYSFQWTVLKAVEFGAPHRRARWWALATRLDIAPGSVTLRLKESLPNLSLYDWSPENEPVRTCDAVDGPKPKHIKNRNFLLGNTLVPTVARVAFLSLFTGLSMPLSDLVSRREWVYTPCSPAKPGRDSAKLMYCGLYRDGMFHPVCKPINDLNLVRPRHLVLDPTVYVSNKPRMSKKKIKPSPLMQEPHTIQFWSTPRTNNEPSNYLTKRSHSDLSTQIRFEQSTENRYGYVNPEYVDWMQGYPRNWTQIPIPDTDTSIDQSHGDDNLVPQ